MINSIQSKLLPAGEHTNTSIRKAFGLPSREVNFVDEDGKKSSYTPNRSQRKAISKANVQTIKRRIFENSEEGKKKLKARAEEKEQRAKKLHASAALISGGYQPTKRKNVVAKVKAAIHRSKQKSNY